MHSLYYDIMIDYIMVMILWIYLLYNIMIDYIMVINRSIFIIIVLSIIDNIIIMIDLSFI